MVKLAAIFIITQMIFLPVFAYANDNDPKVVHIKKGQKAPFEGALLNPPMVGKILAEKIADAARCKEEKEYLLKKAKAKCKRDYDLLKSKSIITEKKLNSIIAIKNKQIKKTEELAIKAAKSNRPWLWGTIGAAAGIAATIGMVFLIKGVSD